MVTLSFTTQDYPALADSFCNDMSDPKYRNNAPSPDPSKGAPRPASSASKQQAATNDHAQKSPTDTVRIKRPKVGLANQAQSGRVKFDSRGNPVWEWQTSTGVYETNVSEEELSKLQSSELSLAATQPVPVIANKKAAAPQVKPKIRSSEDTGFNPYDADNVTRSRVPPKSAAHPALAHKKEVKPPRPISRRVEPQKPEGFWDKVKSKFS